VPKKVWTDDELPVVTVQLPAFNEQYVLARLIDHVCRFDYPREKLEIQVLDDSTDETTEIARAKVAEMRERGYDVKLLHRTDRTGFKAGALEAGMKVARGEFLAIFDSDFTPRPDFLRKTIHHFSDEEVGMVQARWEHLNRRFNFLTNVEAILLDGHFVVESTARCRSGRFVNFNGTAGIWRRQAIRDGGGWQHDTLVEDMDLSYRSQMAGWRFVYLMEETAPAELPVEMNGFKSQQHRWAKGMTQTLLKLGPRIMKSDLPFKVKMEAMFHLSANLAYLCMVLLLVLLLPAMLIRLQHDLGPGAMVYDLIVFSIVTLSFFAFYVTGLAGANRDWKDTLRYLPFLMGMGIGLAVNNTRAVLEALFGQQSPFVRTPKYGIEGRSGGMRKKKYRGARNFQPLLELAMAAYFLVILYVTIHHRIWMGLPFPILFFLSFAYIGSMSLFERWGDKTKEAEPDADSPPASRVGTLVGSGSPKGA
jgi:cellulose synthase/poly-beta-1,6-N-acetylglucosamine synthase-like glycosyltransferase